MSPFDRLAGFFRRPFSLIFKVLINNVYAPSIFSLPDDPLPCYLSTVLGGSSRDFFSGVIHEPHEIGFTHYDPPTLPAASGALLHTIARRPFVASGAASFHYDQAPLALPVPCRSRGIRFNFAPFSLSSFYAARHLPASFLDLRHHERSASSFQEMRCRSRRPSKCNR